MCKHKQKFTNKNDTVCRDKVDATDVCESRQQRTYCYRAHRPSSVMILQVYKVSSCNNRIKKTKLEL